jgi:hypothetical protein
MGDGALRIDYETHSNVQRLVDCVIYSLEGISLAFDKWEEPHVKGPGMYVAIVTGPSVANFADPMGNNYWPTDRCRDVCADLDRFYRTATDVAMSRDGAVVVSIDGVVQKQMVRFKDRIPAADGEARARDGRNGGYEDWMGSRHMSALDTSKRPNVVSTLTLSEETGRVSIFERGSFETYECNELGAEWNPRAH